MQIDWDVFFVAKMCLRIEEASYHSDIVMIIVVLSFDVIVTP